MDYVGMFGAERWLEIAEVRTHEIPKIELELNDTLESLSHTQAKDVSITDIVLEAAHEFELTEALASDSISSVTITTELAMPESHYVQEAPPEPRAPRVVSITRLRQKLGIEDVAPAPRAFAPTGERPRIVRRREAELMAG